MKDYSYLKGKEVVCIANNTWNTTNTKQAKGFVADIDFKIGITIKSTKTQGDLVCLNKKEFDMDRYEWMQISWPDLFNSIVSQIEDGKYSFKKITKYSSSLNNASPCAFK